MPRMSGSHDFSLACMPHTSALHGLLAPILYTLERKGTSHVAQLTSVCVHVSYVDRLWCNTLLRG